MKSKKKARKSSGSWGQSSLHHIYSRSRGGPNISENQYRGWTQKQHQAYHQLFYNLLPSEAIKMIEGWTDKLGALNIEKMGKRNLKAWSRVFDEQQPAAVIRFIGENFLPVEKKFLAGELGGERNDKRKS